MTNTTNTESIQLRTIMSIGADQTLAYVLKGYDPFQRKVCTPLRAVASHLIPCSR